MALKDWLQLTRAHTVPLEAVPAVVGASLGAGTVYNPMVAFWGVVGVLYHLVGYGQNSIEDYNKGYDKGDRHKQHHPMNRKGMMFGMAATFVIYGLMVVSVIVAGAAIYYSPTSNYIPIALVLAVGIVSGFLYNTKGKETSLKFIPITIAHTSIFLIPFLAMGSEHTVVGYSITAYVALWVLFQIAFSGEIKDIGTDEANFMKRMGAEPLFDLDEKLARIEYPEHITRSGVILKMVSVLICYFSIMYSGYYGGEDGGFLAMIIVLAMSVYLLKITGNMLSTGNVTRSKNVKRMSIIEGVTLAIFLITVSPVLGLLEMGTLLVLSVVWVGVMNKIEWGTYLEPRV